jgi:hypothetical protein
MCSPRYKLSNKTNFSSSNTFFCKVLQIFTTLKVSYFLQNFESIQRFFTREAWPWRPWTWCPQGFFLGGKLSCRIMCSSGGRLGTFQETPHFWASTLKVRPPDGIFKGISNKRSATYIWENICSTFLSRQMTHTSKGGRIQVRMKRKTWGVRETNRFSRSVLYLSVHPTSARLLFALLAFDTYSCAQARSTCVLHTFLLHCRNRHLA